MNTYKLSGSGNSVLRKEDGASIPFDPANSDYQKYLKDKAAGALVEPAESAAEIKARMWNKIQAERERRENGGVLVGTHWFHSDQNSRIKLLGIKDQARDRKDAGAPLTEVLKKNAKDLKWKTMAGAFVPVTLQLSIDIINAFGNHDAFAYERAEIHKAQMEAAADPASYDFSGGWPAIYPA